MNFDEHLLNIAVEESNISVELGSSPFGAIIVKDGVIISRAHNTVVKDSDPTAHAEINAIRLACKKLKTFDLSDCILYTSCEPCPMCLSAIKWSNIKTVYYAATQLDADKIGFRDKKMYDDVLPIELHHIDIVAAKSVMKKWFNTKAKKLY